MKKNTVFLGGLDAHIHASGSGYSLEQGSQVVRIALASFLSQEKSPVKKDVKLVKPLLNCGDNGVFKYKTYENVVVTKYRHFTLKFLVLIVYIFTCVKVGN